MKKLVLLLGLMFALQTAMMAQMTDDGQVVFNAHLWKTFLLTVDGVVQEITFDDAAAYNNGVVEGVGVLPGTNLINMETTGNWNLTILAPNFMPYTGGPIGGGNGEIPINNLGLLVEATGDNSFSSGNVTTPCDFASDPPLGILETSQEIIGLGSGNIGDGTNDNTFILHWQMGTQLGTMNNLSMFEQMATVPTPFTAGDFTTIAVLTLTEIP